MEAQAEAVDVFEDPERQPPHGMHDHGRRETVAHLRQDDHQHPAEAVERTIATGAPIAIAIPGSVIDWASCPFAKASAHRSPI